MRAIAVVFIQVVLAMLVGGLVMPAVLFSVPATREAGPLVLAILVAVFFALLRLAWPSSKANSNQEGHRLD